MAKKDKAKREQKKPKRDKVEKKSDAARGPYETRMGQTGANR